MLAGTVGQFLKCLFLICKVGGPCLPWGLAESGEDGGGRGSESWSCLCWHESPGPPPPATQDRQEGQWAWGLWGPPASSCLLHPSDTAHPPLLCLLSCPLGQLSALPAALLPSSGHPGLGKPCPRAGDSAPVGAVAPAGATGRPACSSRPRAGLATESMSTSVGETQAGPFLILKDKSLGRGRSVRTHATPRRPQGLCVGATGQGRKGKRVICPMHPTATAEMGHRGGKVRRRALSSHVLTSVPPALVYL